ncbi:hypothetical protein HZH68_016472 [Vespula germanica]|uniref:Uncharacterized protein n=1 Tax=Vespula germanica TaxID=30212 RepID=A0A834J4T3_VESGE|nr:hypothetical protein HZH68_016472 [Vespula germanica]
MVPTNKMFLFRRNANACPRNLLQKRERESIASRTAKGIRALIGPPDVNHPRAVQCPASFPSLPLFLLPYLISTTLLHPRSTSYDFTATSRCSSARCQALSSRFSRRIQISAGPASPKHFFLKHDDVARKLYPMSFLDIIVSGDADDE